MGHSKKDAVYTATEREQIDRDRMGHAPISCVSLPASLPSSSVQQVFLIVYVPALNSTNADPVPWSLHPGRDRQ